MIMIKKSDRYLIIINIIGFLLFVFHMQLHARKAKDRTNALLYAVALAGGSLGILAAILLLDRKTNKDNMMFRVFIVCFIVIQSIVIFMLKGHHADHMTFAFWTFFVRHKIFGAYIAVMNVITFLAFAVDKFNAVHGRRRVRIITLLGLAFAGGTAGGLFAMYLLRHKTRKDYFTAGMPMILLMQLTVILYIMNA